MSFHNNTRTPSPPPSIWARFTHSASSILLNSARIVAVPIRKVIGLPNASNASNSSGASAFRASIDKPSISIAHSITGMIGSTNPGHSGLPLRDLVDPEQPERRFLRQRQGLEPGESPPVGEL